MVDPEWQGGKKDQRLYRKVRAEKQKVIRKKYDVIQAHLNERGRRLWAGSEAISFGQGGIRAVAAALAMSQKTVIAGRHVSAGQERDPGGQAGPGRKPTAETIDTTAPAVGGREGAPGQSLEGRPAGGLSRVGRPDRVDRQPLVLEFYDGPKESETA